MSTQLSRKKFLTLFGAGAAGALMTACAPQVVTQQVPVTVEVPKEVPVTVEVQSTVQVEVTKEVQVEVTPSGEKPLLRFAMYNFDPWLAALPKMFNDFEGEVGTAQVKLETAPWDQFWTRFESQAAAGIAPDLQIGDPFKVAYYADSGIYLNVDPYLERDKVNLKEWLPATIDACRYDQTTKRIGQGAHWGMPATLVGTILYYNKGLFDAAGVAYPTDKWTRTDYQSAAMKLTKDSAGKTASEAGFNPDDVAVYGSSTIGGYSTAVHLWNNGGGLVSDDQKECWISKPESIEIFQWLQDLVLKDKVNPDPAWFQGQPDTFLTERVAMKIDGSWNVDYYVANLPFKWDIASVPLGTKGLPLISYAGTNTLHIYGGTKTPDQSWDLLKFISGPGGMKYFLATGTPALISAAASPEYMTGQPEHRQVAVDVGAYGRTYYPDLGNDKWKAVYDQEIQALWLGEGDAQTVCPEICAKIDPILASL
jgi:multiple sugar transport system substrate-binding protein